MHAIFDHFAKLVARKGVAPACRSASEHEVRHDTQRADLFIEPDRARLSLLAPLGFLGRLCRRTCTLEFFHGTPGVHDVEACILKILVFRRRRRRKKRSEPIQWMVVSGVPHAALRSFAFRPVPRWGPGVYEAAPRMGTRIVVASELPVTRATLLVRLLAGSGTVLKQARSEVLTLPPTAFERRLAAPVMLQLWPALATGRTPRWHDTEEFRKMMEPMFDTWDELVAARVKRGRMSALADSLLEVYRARFGVVPKPVTASVAAVSEPAVLRGWLALFATADTDAIAAAVAAAPAPAPVKKRAARPRRRARA